MGSCPKKGSIRFPSYYWVLGANCGRRWKVEIPRKGRQAKQDSDDNYGGWWWWWGGGARLAQWWEHSHPTNVAWVHIPPSKPPLLREVFIRLLRFSLSSKINTSKFQFDLERTNTFWKEFIRTPKCFVGKQIKIREYITSESDTE